MGIPELWNTIRDYEQSIPIAQLAEEHFKHHGRPLRIAVDEADWRFNNVTQQQIYAIRASSNEPAYQGIEKHMFYRICRLLTLNIQLVFVFDGPGVPAKRGRNGGRRINWEELHLLKQVLTCFGIPYQEAPGEAEAECARLQILGIVDAVWSQDSDCLMFGCTLWIHDDRVAKDQANKDRSKENTKKNAKTVRVVRASEMQEKLNLSREALVMFAMLVGGDYDTTGLRGCGAAIALRAAKDDQLVRGLIACRNQRDCLMWSGDLAQCLRRISRGGLISIPGDYPNYKVLQKYDKPKVSDDEVLLSSAGLNRNNMRPIDELKLLEVTSSRFNIWGKGYMHWVAPILLVRSMSTRTTMPHENTHDDRMVKQRVKKTDEQSLVRLFERKISFSPFQVTSLQRQDFEGERLGYWDGKTDTPFDPAHRVECEFPDFWLATALLPEVYNPQGPQPKPKTPKRKQQTEAEGHISETPTAKRPKPRESAKNTAPSHPGNPALSQPGSISSATPSRQMMRQEPTGSASRVPASSASSSRHRGRPSAIQPTDVVVLSDDDDEFTLRVPSKGKEYGLAQLRATLSSSAGLDSPTRFRGKSREPDNSVLHKARPPAIIPSGWVSDDGDDPELQTALAMSMQEHTAAHAHSLPRRICEPSGLPNSERLTRNSSPVSKVPYTGLPSGSSTSSSRQHPADAAFGDGLAPPMSSSHTPSKPSPTPSASPASTMSVPLKPIHPGLDASAEIERIREARFRYFDKNLNSLTTAHSMLPSQVKRTIPSSIIPEGTLFIDLTDD